MSKDYYKTLGVSKSASKEEIRQAYKKLAKEYHPDVNKESGSSEKFKEINEAASVLGDDEKRKAYDQYGSEAFKYNAGQGSGQYRHHDFSGFDFSTFGEDFDSIFDFFSGGFGGRSRRANSGRDLAYELTITLKEASEGVKKKIKVTKNDTCTACSGSGGKGEEDCRTCKGSGIYREAKRTPFGIFQTTTTCRHCSGSGSSFKEECSSCNGTGRQRSTKTLEVSIPAGIMDSSRLRVSGEGEAGYRGNSSGDLYIIIHVEEDERFKREGDNLLTSKTISFATAALGGKVKVETLSGESTLKIPAGSQPGDVLALRGEGVKRLHGFGRGDLLVTINVSVPTRLNKKQEKLLQELEDSLAE